MKNENKKLVWLLFSLGKNVVILTTLLVYPQNVKKEVIHTFKRITYIK
ncbi:hypothetical protein [Carnobacterium maltaromaticum]|nr:hypothetical protein [Carnobacterium maltaromaticum]